MAAAFLHDRRRRRGKLGFQLRPSAGLAQKLIGIAADSYEEFAHLAATLAKVFAYGHGYP
jgi:hypothetical protein